MGCRASKEYDDGQAENDHIEKQLRYDQSSRRNEVKILMLGTGDSGKSTVLKQLKFINGPGYSDEERTFFKGVIFTNIVQSMQAVLEAMDVFDIPFASSTTAKPYASLIFAQQQKITAQELSRDVYLAISTLWDDAGYASMAVMLFDPTPLEPWRLPTFDRITIEQDKAQALDQVREIIKELDSIFCTDAAAKDSNLGAAVVMTSQSSMQLHIRQIGIGSRCNWTVHAAELIAIHQATKIIDKEIVGESSDGIDQEKTFTSVSDSQSAIRARPAGDTSFLAGDTCPTSEVH